MSQNLIESITTESNFYTAWDRVRSNLGTPGIDRVSIEKFDQNLQENLTLLRRSIMDSSYQPHPLESFTKEKGSGKKRVLHKLTVRDKVVQQAILLVIQPIYERIFLQCSYAYRPGKSAQKAIERVERNLKRSRVWIVDADIENFFDSMDRQLLMKILAETIHENKLLDLISLCIDALESPGGKGVAQGMILAPLLSNAYLHQMDDRMMRAEWNYLRYSDNVLVLNKSEQQAKDAMARAQTCIQELLLKFNPEKTSICQLSQGFTFLGFYFDEKGKRPSEPSISRLKERLGGTIQHALDYSQSRLHEKIESIIRGWQNYFQLDESDRTKLASEIEQKFVSDEISLPQRILKSALALQLGNSEAAQKLMQSDTVVDSEDAEINFQWGVLCDSLGLNNEALDSYLTAFRNNSEHPEAAYWLGLHYLKHQQNDKALRYLQKAVQNNPQNAAAHFTLAIALQNFSLHGAAHKAFQRAFQIDPQLKKNQRDFVAPAPVKKQAEFRINNQDVDFLLHLFSGREGVFAKQWLNDDGRSGYSTIKQPMRAQDVHTHLSGKETLAYYLMRADNTVNQMVIDIDVTKQVRTEILTEQQQISDWKPLVWSDVLNVCNTFSTLGIKLYTEDSGYKGIHLWMFFTQPLPAREVLLFSKKILATVGAPPPGLHREVFPKEAIVSPQALGSMMKMPLGVHKLTGRRCHFLDIHSNAVNDPIFLLKNIEKVTQNKFYSALDQLKSPAKSTDVQWETDEQIIKILNGCNIIRHLQKKAAQDKMLSHTDRLTLLSVLAYLGEPGKQALHGIISQTLNYSFRITEKWIRRPKNLPVSCPKIRQWQSHITAAVGCFCKFPDKKDTYPSPVLHVDPGMIARLKSNLIAPKSKPQPQISPAAKKSTKDDFQKVLMTDSKQTTTPMTADADEHVVSSETKDLQTPTRKETASPIPKMDKLVNDYLKCKKDLHKLQEKIIELETHLSAAFDQQKIEQFSTALGEFKRIKIEGKYRWIIEV